MKRQSEAAERSRGTNSFNPNHDPPVGKNPALWALAAIGAVLLGFGIYVVHRQIERRIDQIGKL